MQGEGRARSTGPARSASDPGAGPLARLGGPLALAAAFGALAAWSWERWADPLIDFGSELYVAWRLASGDALYRDIAYRHGPLSPYLDAAWFRLFGASLRTLVLCNLAILAATCALAWRVLRPECGRLAAFAAGLTLLAGFGFAHTLAVGNYNWVTPYQHSQTHGVALGIALALAVGAALARRSAAWWLVAGTSLGLVFLTKAEIFVAAAAAAAVGLALEAAAPGRRTARAAAWLAAGALVPVAVAFAALASEMTERLALDGVLGNWRYLGGVLDEPFYAGHAGLDAPWRNAAAALRALGVLAAFAAACLALDRTLPPRRRGLVGGAAAVALFAGLVAARRGVAWHELARALPATSALGVGVLLAACLRRRGDRPALARLAPLALFAVLALALLAKIGLAARIDHYGFALAMPATLLLVAGLVGGAPRLLPPGRGSVARALAVAAVAAALVALLAESGARYARKQVAVGRGADRMLGEGPRAARIAEALERLESLVPVDATLLVLPEGAGLNYWIRRRNPSRFQLFLPTEIAAFGEGAMLADFEAHPPDFVVLAHRDAREFGTGAFGRDPRNGARLREWVDRRYARVARIGPEPFAGEGFGIVILRAR
jgi:hypothetical protein